ncbi:MAG TPA: hypothetical protein VG412_00320 [Acidimicrobiales bacterium]|nr:hypothetical protein [Acidimicrobiales bacterium]
MELIDGAPAGLRSLRGSIWKWTHHERARRAIEEMSRHANSSVAHFGFGGALGETSDEHLSFWLGLPDQWRIQSDERIDLKVGDKRWIGGSAQVTEVDGGSSTFNETELGIFIRPGSGLFGTLRFENPIDDEIAGRPCWRSTANTEPKQQAIRQIPLGVRLGGLDHTFWFDRETGIVLRHHGMIDGEPCAITELKDLVFNPPVSEEISRSALPPGINVVRQIDQLIGMAEMRGVDLTGVDRADLGAVQAAFSDRMRPLQPLPEARKEMQRSKHIPVGEPPVDEVAARSSIEFAFSHFGDRDETGESLVNVQAGEGLAAPLQEAGRRVPGAQEGVANLVVDDIKFLRSDEAVVWFSLEVNGNRLGMVNGREGRALLVGHRWMIERATIVDLLGFAGVTVPPPSD